MDEIHIRTIDCSSTLLRLCTDTEVPQCLAGFKSFNHIKRKLRPKRLKANLSKNGSMFANTTYFPFDSTLLTLCTSPEVSTAMDALGVVTAKLPAFLGLEGLGTHQLLY